MSEKEIETRLRRKMESSGWAVSKQHGTMTNFGRPDLYASHPEHGQWWIEMKKPGGKLGNAQFAWMLKFSRAGCPILVWETEDLDDLLRVMKRDQHGPKQWDPWMTRQQRRELKTGKSALTDALEEWSR